MNHKKLARAALAALVGLGMLGAVAPASAADGSPSITITGQAVMGHDFSAIRIASYTNIQRDTDQTKVTGFDLVTQGSPAFKTALVGKIRSLAGVGAPAATDSGEKIANLDPLVWVAQNWKATGDDDHWGNPKADNENVRLLANWISAGVAEDATNAWGLGNEVSASEGVFSGLADGLYVVWDEDADNQGTSSLPIMVGTKIGGLDLEDQTLGTIEVKGEIVTLDKDIVDAIQNGTNNKPGGDDEAEDVYTAATGQVLEFIIRTNVPFYDDNSFGERVFTITDTWSAGLNAPVTNPPYDANTLDNTLVVTVGAGPSAVRLDARHFTFNVTSATDDAEAFFTLKLNQYGINEAEGLPLTVEYKAKVLAAADLTEDMFTYDTNTAFVTFTNDWDKDSNGTSTGETEDSESDEVDIYTYPFEIVKRDLTTREIIDQNTIKFTVNGPFANENGTVTTQEKEITTINGVAKLHGLQGNATYTVKETVQPDGWSAANVGEKFAFYIEVEKLVEAEGAGVGVPEFHFGEFDADAVVEDGKLASFTPALAELTYVNPTQIDPNPTTATTTSKEGPGGKWIQKGTESAWTWALASDSELVGWDDTSYDVEDWATDHDVDVFNAKSTSDMPATGGQILLWVGIAGALGLGAVTFAAIGARKSRKAAQPA